MQRWAAPGHTGLHMAGITVKRTTQGQTDPHTWTTPPNHTVHPGITEQAETMAVKLGTIQLAGITLQDHPETMAKHTGWETVINLEAAPMSLGRVT